MMGGITIKTPEQVRVYTELLKEPVEIGQHVEEPECMPETDPRWQASLDAGRECPRVDLHPDDALPFRLLLLSGAEHKRQVFDAYFREACAEMTTEERLSVLDRLDLGLSAEAVLDKLYPKPKEQTNDGR